MLLIVFGYLWVPRFLLGLFSLLIRVYLRLALGWKVILKRSNFEWRGQRPYRHWNPRHLFCLRVRSLLLIAKSDFRRPLCLLVPLRISSFDIGSLPDGPRCRHCRCRLRDTADLRTRRFYAVLGPFLRVEHAYMFVPEVWLQSLFV
jgi:hypothetical protein